MARTSFSAIIALMFKLVFALTLAAGGALIPTLAEPPATAPLVRRGDAPQLLKIPADWRLEMLEVPIVFAPDISLKGWEEVRFAPGVFDAQSPNYFTYAFVIAADGEHRWGAPEVKDFLEKYYRGLSTFGGKQADLSQVQVKLSPGERADAHVAAVTFFDQFTDGRKITVRIELQLVNRPAMGQFFLIALISPTPADSDVWKTLRRVGAETAANVPGE